MQKTIIKNNPKLFFIEGMYGDNVLLLMEERIREIKVSKQLLNLIRTSHDEGNSIEELVEKELEGMSEESKKEHRIKIENLMKWLVEKGVVQLV